MLSLQRAKCTARAPVAKKCVSARPAVGRSRPGRGTTMVTRAAESQDFDALLASWAEKFEKSDNKVAVIGYIAAASGAFVVAEWLIHLPVLDFLLGFPVQLVGLLSLPLLVNRYYLDSGNDITKDLGDEASKIVAKLPGLGK